MIKKLLQEKNSVSEDVIAITDKIYSEICDDFEKTETFLSKTYGFQEVKENIIRVSLTDIDERLGNLTVRYTVYLAEKDDDIKTMEKFLREKANSQYDDETGVMTIATIFQNGNFVPDTEGIIYHEVTHFYQYRLGMEKRVSLYGKMHDYIDAGDDNVDAYYVALALYYTFPHEQDAFAHEFYSLLLKNNGDLDIEKYEHYRWAKYASNIVKRHYKGDNDMVNTIKDLGYSVKDYFLRLHYGLKRFERKLTNVLIRYEVDQKEKEMTIEQRVKRNIKIGCKYLTEGKEYFFPKRKYEHFFEF